MAKTYSVREVATEPVKDEPRTAQRVLRVIATGLSWADAKVLRKTNKHYVIFPE